MKKTNKIKQWARRMALKTLFPPDERSCWIPIIQETDLGSFQMDESTSLCTSLSHPTVYACVSQIAYDVGKLRLDLTKEDKDGIAIAIKDPIISPLLVRPNPYQTFQKFIESWLISLLTNGNTYVLKARNANRNVVSLYILDPNKVNPLVSTDGSVFYQLKKDRLSTITKDIEAIPAYEIIHDTMITLFHPLVGVSPLYAAARAVKQGLAMQTYSAYFFENKAQPGGFLSLPGKIKKETADAIRSMWASRYGGENTGKIAVLSDGMTYESISENAEDSQLIDQLNWSDEKICSVFKVPPYKVHVGKPPTYEQSETLDRKYYSDCLQRHIESIERLLNEGLSLPANQGMQFNLDDLMRMDMALKMKTAAEGVKGGIYAPDEARRKFNLPAVKGGHTPYMQQQNYSLAALDERDKLNPLAIMPGSNSSDSEEKEKQIFKNRMEQLIYETNTKNSGTDWGN